MDSYRARPEGLYRRLKREATGFASESEMRDYVVDHLGEVEEGLVPLGGVEHAVEVRCKAVDRKHLTGAIDILAGGPHPHYTIIECKLGLAKPHVLGQVLGYMAWMHKTWWVPEPVRSIIVAQKFSPALIDALELYDMLPVSLVAMRPDRSFVKVR